MLPHILSNRRRALVAGAAWFLAALLAVALGACGGGGGMGSSATMSQSTPQGCSSATCGTALLTLTDASGDFTTYTVNVTSLQLTTKNGAVVETLPATARVDFTQLVDVTELVTAAAIPNGEYVSATMTLDYTGADVEVDVNGTSTVASTVDANGNPLSTLTLTVTLDNAHHFFVNGGQLSRLALDFNLAASNSVNSAVTPPVVTVQPFIVATAVPSDTKPIRVRGQLVSVDTSTGTYTIGVEPFDGQAMGHGQVVVNTTAQTAFEVNGVSSTGSAGITALNALPAGTLTVAFGTLDTSSWTFTASQVLAGSSVQMPGKDGLVGVVVSRSGNTLLVSGATLQSHTDFGQHFLPGNVTLSIGNGTHFMAFGNPAIAPTLASPSVGSRITAFGTAGTAAGGNQTFDATAGVVRLEVTHLWGFPTATAGNTVTVDLQAIEGIAPSAFNFAGTGAGTASAPDANPAAYVIATGNLPITTLMPPAGAPASAMSGTSSASSSSTGPATRFEGLVQPFGMAPPDFNALSFVSYANVDALLVVSFGSSGSSSGFTTVSATQLVLNLAASVVPSAHFIEVGPQLIDLTMLASSPSIVPAANGTGPFALRTVGSGSANMVSVFNGYAAFETALTQQLSGSSAVLKVVAIGQYDQTSNTFTATQIGVLLE